jgi:hypothetical protein
MEKNLEIAWGYAAAYTYRAYANTRFSILKTEHINLVIEDFLMTENND